MNFPSAEENLPNFEPVDKTEADTTTAPAGKHLTEASHVSRDIYIISKPYPGGELFELLTVQLGEEWLWVGITYSPELLTLTAYVLFPHE